MLVGCSREPTLPLSRAQRNSRGPRRAHCSTHGQSLRSQVLGLRDYRCRSLRRCHGGHDDYDGDVACALDQPGQDHLHLSLVHPSLVQDWPDHPSTCSQPVLSVVLEYDVQRERQTDLTERYRCRDRLDPCAHQNLLLGGYDHGRDGYDCRAGSPRPRHWLRRVLEARAESVRPLARVDCRMAWSLHPLLNGLRCGCRGGVRDHHDCRLCGRLGLNDHVRVNQSVL